MSFKTKILGWPAIVEARGNEYRVHVKGELVAVKRDRYGFNMGPRQEVEAILRAREVPTRDKVEVWILRAALAGAVVGGLLWIIAK